MGVPLIDLAGLDPSARTALEKQVEGLTTLERVLRWGDGRHRRSRSPRS